MGRPLLCAVGGQSPSERRFGRCCDQKGPQKQISRRPQAGNAFLLLAGNQASGGKVSPRRTRTGPTGAVHSIDGRWGQWVCERDWDLWNEVNQQESRGSKRTVNSAAGRGAARSVVSRRQSCGSAPSAFAVGHPSPRKPPGSIGAHRLRWSRQKGSCRSTRPSFS